MSSGLFKELITRKLLIPHTEVKHDSRDPNIYTLIKPDQISFLSYPFEWSYNQWRKVILSYLEINLIALKFGMILKDATPYNFYLHEGNAVLFDTSSFAFFKTPDYWLSYKQFCEEMLGPFALMHYNGFKWGKLTRASHRGLPIDFISKNLALKSKLNLTCLVHLHLHANSYHKRNTDQLKSKSGLSVEKLSELISMIKSTINEWDKSYQYPNHWVNYYEKDIETTEYLLDKETTLKSYIEYCSPKRVVDLGANTGKFSEIASQYAETVIAYEYDETCVDYIESQIKEKQKNNLYTVIGDLSETSPNFGLLNKEHISIINRTNSDLVLALALVHHLALPKMIPFELITDILYNFTSRFSIVEFIERSDRKVQHLLKDNPRYYPTKQEFEEIISEKFNIIKQRTLESSVRTIYLLEKC
jgi:SAM-dependent methyltransferase